ncbi:Large ribosomal subunit protein uL22m [Nakaseomyces bracarensis]|uniref:Large ribosomal subunit protein uL22m n=1 Tax=Nakaseomyces bracarensis TaxID=273131 RepID=A0ABR4NUM6_9SACH
MFPWSRIVARSIIRPIRGSRTTNKRFLNSSSVWLNNKSANQSLFGSITDSTVKDADSNDPTKVSNRLEAAVKSTDDSGEIKVNKDDVTFENDEVLQKFIRDQHQKEALAPELLLSPLKRQVYELNCKANGGFYKKDTVVTIPETKEKFQLKLTKQELEALEPSVYLRSYRLKYSTKKAIHLLRMLSGLDVKKAITQCHFSDKKIARDIAELLQKGIKDGERLGLNADDLYISQIWSGNDGWLKKRIEYKGRGRIGIIRHRSIHVRCILKTHSVTKKRLEYEKQLKEKMKKPWVQLADRPVRGVPGSSYKW